MMRNIVLIIFCFLSIAVNAQNPNAAEIRKKMATIRQNTDWNNPESAKKANEEIRALSKQLMMGAASVNQPENEQDKVKQEDALEESVDYKMKLWEQMWATAHQGKNANIDLAKPLREEIVEAYEEDESKEVSNPMYFQEMTFLCIDMSMPGIQKVIDQMENYKSIEMLVITGGKSGVPVDLPDLLGRAKNYPLKTLYIINFKQFVQAIPSSIGQFNGMRDLMLYNNQLENIPVEIGSLTSLKKLYVDMNPLSVLSPSIAPLSELDTLGIMKTLVPDEEIEQIVQLLPNCKILNQ